MKRYAGILLLWALIITPCMSLAATSITTRSGKGQALTWSEMDTNLSNLRDATDGYAASLGASIASLLQSQTAGTIGFQTVAAMNADLAHAANKIALVTNDPTTTNNTYWIKLGASGFGSWQKSSMPSAIPMVNASLYADFATAVSAQGSTPTTLVVSELMPVTTAITVPSTITLQFVGGGYLSLSGAGAVTGLKEARPEWFGTGIAGLQAAANAITLGGTLYITSDLPSLSGKVTIANNNITITGNGLRSLTWTTLGSGVSYGSLGTGTAAFEVTGQNVTFENLKLVGPTSGAYVGNEGAITMVGSSTSSRKNGLHFKNVEISDFGSYGVYTQFVDNITFDSRCYLHNLGKSGMTHLSPRFVRVGAMRIKTITPGSDGQMYGMSFSHHSVGYHLDPNVATPLAAHPFPQDVVVDGATVEDVNWNPIDFHGGYNSTVTNCKVFNSLYGIALTSGSGDSTPYVGWVNSITNNLVDGRNPDGTASGRENTGHGIVAQGTSTMQYKGLLISGNMVISKGVVSNSSSAAIIVNYSEATITGNTVESFGGNGILFNGATAITLSANTANGIASAADTTGRAFSIATATPIKLVASGNKLLFTSGTAAPKIGLYAFSVTQRPAVSGNDFTIASSSQISLPTNGYVKGGDFGCVFSVSALNAGTTSITGGDKDVLIAFNLATGDTLTDVPGGVEGQTLTMMSTGAGSVTVSHNSYFTNTSGANITLGTRDVVTYKRWGSRWLMQNFAVNP